MDIEQLFDTPRKIGMFAGSVAFLILFPAYFAWMPLVDEGIVVLSLGGGQPIAPYSPLLTRVVVVRCVSRDGMKNASVIWLLLRC